ncbi:MAG: cobalamin biosynthesis central domain-containing protein, partial [Desulfitobacteriaceae bacterium]|nr:cobalamin biosynthesis central domain-containing protein [Desulfitobacteriaceae bacterium]
MTAVITLTKAAADVGSCIREQIPDAVLYVQARYGKDFPAAEIIDGKLPLFVKGLWDAYSRLIFIMAAGIVVRMIAPLLSSKTEDPAVVVLDEKGQCVISLLAGHWGGANELAREIAAGLGALPVITTATDVEGLPAWDELARRNGCTLENSGHLKKITGLMLDGQTVAVYHSVKLTVSLPDHVLILENRSALPGINSGPHEYHALVQIGEELLEPRELGGLPCAVLRPRNLVIG